MKSTLSTVSSTKMKSTVSTASSTKMNSTISTARGIEYYFAEYSIPRGVWDVREEVTTLSAMYLASQVIATSVRILCDHQELGDPE